MKRIKMLLVVLVFAVLSGCATYGAKGVMPNMNEPVSLDKTKLSTKMGEGLVVSAYPLTTKEETEKYFDEDLSGDNVLAIFLEIQNENNDIRLTAANFNFDGAQSSVSLMALEDVLRKLHRNPWGRGIFWYIFGFYVGAPISAYATYETNVKIEEDLKNNKLLFLSNITKGTTKGFMCFRIPESNTDSASTTPKGKLNLIFQKEMRLIEYSFDINK